MRKILLILGLMLILLGSPGCNVQKRSEQGTDTKPEEKAEEERVVISVEAEKPHRASISVYQTTQTRVEAENRVELTSKGTGTCTAVLVEEGDRVRVGQVLAELDKNDMQLQVLQSENQYLQALSEYNRTKQLESEGLAARVELESAEHSLKNAETTLEIQKRQLEDQTIRATIDGLITRKNIQPGVMVSPGTPVFDIVDPASFVLNIQVPEDKLPQLRLKQRAEVTFESIPDETFQAWVSRINPSIDSNPQYKGTVKVRLELARNALKAVREAAFARVRLVMETHENALLVPKDAVDHENERTTVLIVSDEPPESGQNTGEEEAAAEEANNEMADSSGTESEKSLTGETEGTGKETAGEPRLYAKRVDVEVGLEDSNSTEILSGIDDDTLVITLGQRRAKPGTEIEVTTAAEQMAAFEDISADEALDRAKVEHEKRKRRVEEEKRATQKRETDDGSTEEKAGDENS